MLSLIFRKYRLALFAFCLLPFLLAGCIPEVHYESKVMPIDVKAPEKGPSFPSLLEPGPGEIQTFTYPVAPGSCGGYKFNEKTSKGTIHNGLDIGSSRKGGEEIHSTWKGTVRKHAETGSNDGFGTFAVVEYKCSDIPQSDKDSMNGMCKDGQSVYMRYAHMELNSNGGLQDGSEILPGSKIGNVGNTGNAEGYVLHLETRIGDSGQYAPSSGQKLTYDAYNDIGKSFIDPQTILKGICEK